MRRLLALPNSDGEHCDKGDQEYNSAYLFAVHGIKKRDRPETHNIRALASVIFMP
jgi:hypothetical protein